MHVQNVCSEFPILFQDFSLQELQTILFRLKQMKTQKGERVNIFFSFLIIQKYFFFAAALSSKMSLYFVKFSSFTLISLHR